MTALTRAMSDLEYGDWVQTSDGRWGVYLGPDSTCARIARDDGRVESIPPDDLTRTPRPNRIVGENPDGTPLVEWL